MQAAHAKNLKVLFDYAMVHVHTESAVYTQHKNDSPAGSRRSASVRRHERGCGNYDNYSCWFAPYLAHYDYTNSAAARTFSVNAAISAHPDVRQRRLPPRRHQAGRPELARGAASRRSRSQILRERRSPQQRFYMVGETYDFQNRGLIASFIDPSTKLDGQFDFPLRIRLVEARAHARARRTCSRRTT